MLRGSVFENFELPETCIPESYMISIQFIGQKGSVYSVSLLKICFDTILVLKSLRSFFNTHSCAFDRPSITNHPTCLRSFYFACLAIPKIITSSYIRVYPNVEISHEIS